MFLIEEDAGNNPCPPFVKPTVGALSRGIEVDEGLLYPPYAG